MAGVLPHQIAAAFRGAMLYSMELQGMLPGHLWYGKVPPGTAVPYATLAIEQTAKEVHSKGTMITSRATSSTR